MSATTCMGWPELQRQWLRAPYNRLLVSVC